MLSVKEGRPVNVKMWKTGSSLEGCGQFTKASFSKNGLKNKGQNTGCEMSLEPSTHLCPEPCLSRRVLLANKWKGSASSLLPQEKETALLFQESKYLGFISCSPNGDRST